MVKRATTDVLRNSDLNPHGCGGLRQKNRFLEDELSNPGAPGSQPVEGWSFELMNLDGLFAMKSALLLKRARSRDYFDLMWFCQHGKTLDDILAAARMADDAPDTPVVVEHKLLSLLPLDAEDEGLDPVGLTITLADIHAFFESLVQAREIAEARKLLEQSPPSKRGA